MNHPPWLEEPIATVARLGERLPHALLIQGPGGWGEERVATAIALDLMGLAPESTVWLPVVGSTRSSSTRFTTNKSPVASSATERGFWIAAVSTLRSPVEASIRKMAGAPTSGESTTM